MRELFGIVFLLALIWVLLETQIPAKSVAAAEAWLDAQVKGAGQ